MAGPGQLAQACQAGASHCTRWGRHPGLRGTLEVVGKGRLSGPLVSATASVSPLPGCRRKADTGPLAAISVTRGAPLTASLTASVPPGGRNGRVLDFYLVAKNCTHGRGFLQCPVPRASGTVQPES